MQPSQAQECCRKTLLQWSYGTSFEGGPDLDEPLVTDRPDFTESSVTVGYGVAQLEMGYTYTYDDTLGESTRSHSYPESLLRVGTLADWFELRVAWNFGEEGNNEFGIGSDTASGAEDLYLGTKLGPDASGMYFARDGNYPADDRSDWLKRIYSGRSPSRV